MKYTAVFIVIVCVYVLFISSLYNQFLIETKNLAFFSHRNAVFFLTAEIVFFPKYSERKREFQIKFIINFWYIFSFIFLLTSNVSCFGYKPIEKKRRKIDPKKFCLLKHLLLLSISLVTKYIHTVNHFRKSDKNSLCKTREAT